MRITHKEPVHVHIGQVRSRTSFLWIPKTIQGQTRWLERATWMEWARRDGSNSIQWVPYAWCGM